MSASGCQNPSRQVLGGEFELADIALADPSRLAIITKGMSGTWTASGRGALGLVLRRLKERGICHVHLPAYLCESVLQPVKALGMDFSFYPVGPDLGGKPEPPRGAALLCIHYFGWLDPHVKDLEDRCDLSLIQDASQALLSKWRPPINECGHVILSVRKFAGPPFLGWCSVESSPTQPGLRAEMMAWRILAARLAKGAYLSRPKAPVDCRVEDFYLEAFGALERYFDENPLEFGVPALNLCVAAGIDWEQVRIRRRENWLVLAELLEDAAEPLFRTLPDEVCPLGYVIRLKKRDELRKKLMARRIFCPVHWPLPVQVDSARFPQSHKLANSLMTLPIDQRYGVEDMERLANNIKEVFRPWTG